MCKRQVEGWVGRCQAILNRATGKPDPAATYRVPVARSPVDGAPDALVTMVVASEVGDLYVGRLMPIIGQLQATYGNDLRIVWKSFIVRPLESQAAALGLCAAGRSVRRRLRGRRWRQIGQQGQQRGEGEAAQRQDGHGELRRTATPAA